MMRYPEADSDRAQADALNFVLTSIETCLNTTYEGTFIRTIEGIIHTAVCFSIGGKYFQDYRGSLLETGG